MLIGIAPCISPELLSVLHRMGHGDELVLADAFFPGDAFNARVVRADGIRIPELLDGILALINLDSYGRVRRAGLSGGDRPALAGHAQNRPGRALRLL